MSKMLVDMEFNGKIIPVPSTYICPITLNLMSHPLLSKTGMHYERSAILAWLVNSDTCPMTRQPLHLSNLISDRALEQEIKCFAERHGISQHVDDYGVGDVTDHRIDDESLSVYAVGSYVRSKQTPIHRQQRFEHVRRLVRRRRR